MFVAIFVMCVMNNGGQECSAVVSKTPFYTKKECTLATEAKSGGKTFTCFKVGGEKKKQ